MNEMRKSNKILMFPIIMGVKVVRDFSEENTFTLDLLYFTTYNGHCIITAPFFSIQKSVYNLSSYNHCTQFVTPLKRET